MRIIIKAIRCADKRRWNGNILIGLLVIFYAMFKESGCFLVQDLVTALPLANGHGTITSHFGELVRQCIRYLSLALWLLRRASLACAHLCQHVCCCCANADHCIIMLKEINRPLL